MKNKKIMFLGSSLLPIISMPFLVSCITTTHPNNLDKNIENKFDIDIKPVSLDEERTKKFINEIIDLTFKNNNVNKVNFINSQKNEKALFEEFKKVSSKYLSNKKDTTSLKALKDFYSKNWLFVIKNIDKFSLTFEDWWTLPEQGEIKHSDKFLNKVKEKKDEPDPKDRTFVNPYYFELKEGDESKESPTSVFYLSKNDLLIRLFISKKNNETKLEIDKFIYFPPRNNEGGGRNIKVSIKLLSDIIHSGIIHKDIRGYQEFERTLVENYNHPALGNLVLKEDIKNEKNK